ncbi:MAG: hypothetical protein KJO07_06290 [Deltaproteobacteria bacterium]|nr:hypothetical protein [Deltaproteobacteria bacterium]
MARLRLIVIALLALSCSEGDANNKASNEASPKSAKSGDDGADKPDDKRAKGKDEGQETDSTPPRPPAALALPPRLAVQEIGGRISIAFHGWSNDGRMFAVDSTYAEGDPGDGAPELVVREVYGAEQGGFVKRFLWAKAPTGRFPRRWRKLVDETSAKNTWPEFAANWGFDVARSGRSLGDWSLESVAKPRTVTPYATFDTKNAGSGFLARWEYYNGARTDADRKWLMANEGKKLKQRAPRFEIVADNGKQRRTLLETGAPFKRDELEEYSQEATVETMTIPHWSPAGSQVALLVIHNARLDSTGVMPSAHVYLRTLGPQIKVVSAGADPIRVASFLSKLRMEKIPLVQFEVAKEPSEVRKIYYRRDGMNTAKRIAGWLGKTQVERLAKDGWVDIIVFLGLGS